MKKRIDTLMYDTDTAKKMGEYCSGPADDFNYTHEILYKKRTGEFFLWGEGGPESVYSHRVDNMFVGGEDIRPLTYDQAKKWFEKANNDDPDWATDKVYDAEFDRPKKDEKKTTASISLSLAAKRKLERLATKQGITQSEVVENMILNE